MRFDNGAIGTFAATTAAYPGFPDGIEIIGTKGSARIEDTTLSAHFHDGAEMMQTARPATAPAPTRWPSRTSTTARCWPISSLRS